MIFSRKQNEYILEANKRWNFKIGAVRSGKSYVDVAQIIPERLRAVADKDGLNLILGVSKETIERNVLQPMREIYTSSLVGIINNRNIAQVCGVPVYCLGAEKVNQVAKIQGSSVKYCYGDEMAKWNNEVFTMLASRLDKEYSKFDGACNPENPSHWLKKFIDRDDIDSYVQHYKIFDNPFLPKSVIRNLCKEYAGTIYYDRYILGLWTLAEGLVYQNFKNAIVDKVPEGKPSEICVSMDYGTQNPFAAILWEKYGKVWYAVREYYWGGRENQQQKADNEYGEDMINWLAPEISRLRPGEKIRVIIDPSAASFIALLKKAGWAKVISGDNDVLDGIRETATAMQIGAIKVLSSLVNWRHEVESYVWDAKATVDKVVKANDHLQDATRYFVRTMRIVKKFYETEYQSIFL